MIEYAFHGLGHIDHVPGRYGRDSDTDRLLVIDAHEVLGRSLVTLLNTGDIA